MYPLDHTCNNNNRGAVVQIYTYYLFFSQELSTNNFTSFHGLGTVEEAPLVVVLRTALVLACLRHLQK